MISAQEIIFRLLVAVVFCGAVGLQRALTGKAAGMRTHILVGVGAAIFTLVSGYAFNTTAANADRIAAQIVSGIGFIGGGAILKERGSIKGLTTAAGLWTAAALGMAAGAGLYLLGLIGTIIILAALVGLRYVEVRFPRRMLETWAVSMVLSDGTLIPRLRAALKPNCHKVALVALTHDATVRLTYQVEIRRTADVEAITAALRAAGAQTVMWHAQGDAEVEVGP